MRGRPSKYLEMLRDREVARWYGQVSQGSKKTAKVYLRRLGYACDRYHTTPRAVAKLDKRGIRDFLVDMVNDMDARGNAGGYTPHCGVWPLGFCELPVPLEEDGVVGVALHLRLNKGFVFLTVSD